MQAPLPPTRDLVLVGGGHAHALVLRRWGMNPLPGARLTVINPAPGAPYTGMLPGLVAGHYRREELDIDLVRLARFAGARIVLGMATGIDREARRITVPDRPPIRYDLLSLDIGVGWDLPEIEGMEAHGLPVKPMGPFARAWDAFVGEVEAGRRAPSVAIIGAGVAGVEIAMAMAHRLRGRGARITLIEAGTPLATLPPAARRPLLARLRDLGVDLRAGARVARVTADGPVTQTGDAIAAGLTVAAAGPRPQAWLADTGLALEGGYVRVDRTLRSVTDPRIFAAGDCAHLDASPRPKAGVYAVRAAPVLHRNLRAALAGSARGAFRPQREFLKLISLGGKEALGHRGPFRFQGAWAWRLKDRIDRRFMDRFHDLPPMRAEVPRGAAAQGARARALAQAPCAGCGAKVGQGALGAALAALPRPARDDVAQAPGDDAGILTMGGVRQVVSTDHLRAFTPDPYLLARVAAVHALGDVWAMGALPQAALAQVILPHADERVQAGMLAEIMAGAAEVFTDAGADIVGGHTTQGAEMSVGFTVTGLAGRPPILLSGARPGDALILTKGLGSGTVLAAEMALQATGAEVAACWEAMQVSQGAAARLLAGAHAMTDVTGFGLAGHLAAMMRASGTAAEVDLASVPLLPGAARLARAGVRSTLHEANRQGAMPWDAPESAAAALMFDPQTGGGLLAAVTAETADAVLEALIDQGIPAARIGRVGPGPTLLRFV